MSFFCSLEASRKFMKGIFVTVRFFKSIQHCISPALLGINGSLNANLGTEKSEVKMKLQMFQKAAMDEQEPVSFKWSVELLCILCLKTYSPWEPFALSRIISLWRWVLLVHTLMHQFSTREPIQALPIHIHTQLCPSITASHPLSLGKHTDEDTNLYMTALVLWEIYYVLKPLMSSVNCAGLHCFQWKGVICTITVHKWD